MSIQTIILVELFAGYTNDNNFIPITNDTKCTGYFVRNIIIRVLCFSFD